MREYRNSHGHSLLALWSCGRVKRCSCVLVCCLLNLRPFGSVFPIVKKKQLVTTGPAPTVPSFMDPLNANILLKYNPPPYDPNHHGHWPRHRGYDYHVTTCMEYFLYSITPEPGSNQTLEVRGNGTTLCVA